MRLTEADRRRIESVFEDHRGFIEAVATQHAGHIDAPDIVGAVGLRLCQSLNGLRDPKAIRTWIYRVTVSVARDHVSDRLGLERTREQLAAVSSAEEHVEVPDEVVQRRQRAEAFREALDRLKKPEKRLICNSLEPGRVHVSNGADRVALHRARQKLRRYLLSDPRLSDK